VISASSVRSRPSSPTRSATCSRRSHRAAHGPRPRELAAVRVWRFALIPAGRMAAHPPPPPAARITRKHRVGQRPDHDPAPLIAVLMLGRLHVAPWQYLADGPDAHLRRWLNYDFRPV